MPFLLQPRSLVLLLSGAVLGVLLHHLLAAAGFVPSSTCLPLQALLWPGAAVLIAALLAQALVVVARLGIRVEIFTHSRSPIDISTRSGPIQAEVTRVRL
jgi:hypothetical protein